MRPSRPLIRLAIAACAVLLGTGTLRAAPPRQGDDAIHYGQVVQGRLSPGQPDERWRFSGRAGDLIMVDMQAGAPDDLDTYLALADADGNTLLSDDDSGEGLNARLGPFALPAAGEYWITASLYSGSGDYTLQLISLDRLPAIQPGKPLIGVVNREHPGDYFLLRGSTDDRDRLFRLSVTDEQHYADPVLSLYGPQGYLTSTEYQTEGIIDPLVPDPGMTYVIVVSWNTAGQGGPYELSLELSDVALLRDGDTQRGAINEETPTGTHFLRGEAGQQVRISVTAAGFSPAVRVSTMGYEEYLFSSEGTGALEVEALLALPHSTVYVVEISDGGLAGAAGTYEIRLAVVQE